MKKIIITYVVICIGGSAIVYKASCQSIANFVGLSLRTKETVRSNPVSPVTIAKLFRNDINIRAARGFIRDFNEAENVTWLKANDGGYIAQFIIDSINTRVAYNHNGSWTYTLKKYSENKMPAQIRSIVKGTFTNYNISSVAEVNVPQEREYTIYRVIIKKDDNFKILQVCNNEMLITGDYTKP